MKAPVCTLLVDTREPSRMRIAANRDESLTRPARSPFRWEDGIVAPLDEQAHGTWLGFSPKGFFVGVTNRFGAPRHLDRESRGTLVVEALHAESVEALHRTLAALPSRRFNAFHLLYTDGEKAFVTWSDGERVSQETLGRGLHLVTERSYGAAEQTPPRVAWLKRHWSALPPDAPLEARAALLAHHDESDPLAATCVHLDSFGYGTRSSLLFDAKDRVIRFTDGKPCVSAWKTFTG
jgi:hypothetical protein